MKQPSSTRSLAGVTDPVRTLGRAVAPVIHALESRQLFAVSLDAAGWTVIDHAGVSDYREIYVSQSTGNNAWDGTAPENIPGTSRGPKKTIAAGNALMRSGKSDWLLLKKGDAWNENITSAVSGVDAQNPAVFTSYGTGARPVVYGNGGTGLGSTARANVAFLGIEFYNRLADPANPNFNTAGTGSGTINMGGRNILVEDCYFNYRGVVAQGTGTYRHRDLTFRRNTFANAWAKGSDHIQGLYGSSADRMTVEENVFYRSGWNPDIAGAGATIYNHALYLQWSVSEAIVKNNIIVQPSSVGAQVRGGGVVDDNLFIDAEYAFFTGRAASIARENVVMSLVGNVASQLNEQAVSQAGIQSFAPWQITEGNIVANRIESSGRSPKVAYEINPDDGATGSTPASSGAGYYDLPRSDTTFRGNVDYNWGASTSATSNNATTLISGNYFNKLTFVNNTFHQDRYAIGSIRYSPSNLSGKETFDGNQYYAGPIAASKQFMIGSTYYDAAGWQARTGETNATLAPAQFVDPTRNALTYLAANGAVGATPASFYSLLLSRSKDNWIDGLLTAPKINDHVRAGFVKAGQAVNADPVLAVNQRTRVTPGKGIVVSSNQLQVTDADNAAADLVYFLETLPQHGTVRLNNARVDRFRTFTQADIDAGRLTYEHNGDSASTDSFGFRVSDGRHGTVEASTFTVNIANPPVIISGKPGAAGGTGTGVGSGTVTGTGGKTQAGTLGTRGNKPVTARGDEGVVEFDVVNNQPLFEAGNAPPLTLYVDENAPVNRLLGRAVASDPDLGQQLTWSIDGYKNDDLFRVDPYTGNLRLQFFAAGYDSNYAVRKLDYEVTPQYTINVRVTDDGTNPQTNVIPVTIIVRDSPEAPVAPAAFSVNVGEETAVGSPVANWVATDQDAGDSVAYSISAGNGAGKFAIDASGQITLVGGLNYATAGQYVLTIRATDTTSRFAESKVTVNVKALPKLAVNLGAALNAEQTVTLTTARLQTTDADSAATALVYTVTTAATLGTVNLNGVALAVGGTFTQADVDAGRVSYTHAVAAAAGTDGFAFTVRDERGGTIAGSFALTITDAPPLILPPTAYAAGKGMPTYQFTARVTDDRAAGNLLYTWSVDGAPAGVSFGETNGTNAASKIFATFSLPGTYTVRLTVGDGVNPPVTDTVTLTIIDRGAPEGDGKTARGGTPTKGESGTGGVGSGRVKG